MEGKIHFSFFYLKSDSRDLTNLVFCASRWIGLIWSENEEMINFELLVYYTEHAFTSFLGPVVLSLGGRFDPLSYAGWPLPVCGFHLFVAYMRYVLTPLS